MGTAASPGETPQLYGPRPHLRSSGRLPLPLAPLPPVCKTPAAEGRLRSAFALVATPPARDARLASRPRLSLLAHAAVSLRSQPALADGLDHWKVLQSEEGGDERAASAARGLREWMAVKGSRGGAVGGGGGDADGASPGSTSPGPGMIKIHVLEGKALVWNDAEVRRIREEHRIVGVLVGALARKPRQNVRLGLPLQLLPEEARLLVEKGFATLHKNPASQPCGDDTSQDASALREVAAYQNELEESYQGQLQLAAEQRMTKLGAFAERIAQGRAKKREQKGGEGDPPAKLADLEPAFVLPRESMMVQLPTERVRPGHEEDVDCHVPSEDWPYTGQPDHEMRYCIFRNLWEKGFYVTSGSKFGGDFLVYPGDPMRFHAHYIALCVSKDTALSLYDIISMGRLGTNVKKTILLCSVDQDGAAVYTSLQWSGMQ